MLKNKGDQFLILSDKAKKIIIVCFIVLSSIFISGYTSNLYAFSKDDATSVYNELKDYKTSNFGESNVCTNEQLQSFLDYYTSLHSDYHFVLTNKWFVVSSSPIIYESTISYDETKERYDFSESFKCDSFLVYIDVGSYAGARNSSYFIPHLSNNSASFGGSSKSDNPFMVISWANHDIKNPNGDVVFQAPVEPLISPKMVEVLPETVMAELSEILPIGLVALSVVLLIFLLNRWKKSFNL